MQELKPASVWQTKKLSDFNQVFDTGRLGAEVTEESIVNLKYYMQNLDL